MNTGKHIALTIQTFVDKVMSLLFNTLGNPIGRGVWQATVHRVTKESDTI